MENKNWLENKSVCILSNLSIRLPTVREILKNEQDYYNLIYTLTSTPYSYMVQLDKMGCDYTKISEYELFILIFNSLKDTDLSILFGDLNTSGFEVIKDGEDKPVLYNPISDIVINKEIAEKITTTIRTINSLEKSTEKPGNAEAANFILDRKKKEFERARKKKYVPYLKNCIVALVNNQGFKYNYETSMDLTIYQLNESLRQIKHQLVFDKTMTGIYTGMIDRKSISDESILSFVNMK